MSNFGRQFEEKTTAFIRDLAQQSAAVRALYYYDPEHENIPADLDRDLLLEKRMTKAKGLVQKYPGRVLFLLSYTCAAHCRYCERQDRVGVGLDAEGRLTPNEIRSAVDYIRQHSNVTEVIFSGGDPLTHPKGLQYASELLAEIPHVKILRIHTRFPMQLPDRVDFDLLEDIISSVPQTFYFSLHIDHPDELTMVTENVISRVRKLGYILLCQSVFLKGVNDSVDTLARLYTRLAELGVRPYYIYHCQSIPTTQHFVMRLEDEIRIMTKLREQLSGIAFPQLVLDLQNTTGKIIAPTTHWNVDLTVIRDFMGNEYSTEEKIIKIQDIQPPIFPP